MIHIVYGTRAELIKFSSLIKELEKRKIKFKLVDTGQHDNESLRKSLKIPKPNYFFGKSLRKYWSKFESRFFSYPIAATLALSWGLGTFLKLVKIFRKEGNVVICHGNSMTVPLVVYATKFSPRKIKLVHYESGLRGNKKSTLLLDLFYKLADHNSHYLFTPSPTTLKNLKKENVKGKIIFTGNVMPQVVANTINIKPKTKIQFNNYVLANLTRSIVTRNDAEEIVKSLVNSPFNISFFLNPVIKNRIEKYGLLETLQNSNHITLEESIDYPDFLHLIKNSSGVITDSTGVQEECMSLGKPCIVTNDFIQFPEFQQAGVRVTGCDSKKILKSLQEIKERRGLHVLAKKNRALLGSKNATLKIANQLAEML